MLLDKPESHPGQILQELLLMELIERGKKKPGEEGEEVSEEGDRGEKKKRGKKMLEKQYRKIFLHLLLYVS